MKKGCINEIYNIGSDYTITTIELLNKIERMLSMSSRIKQEESDAFVNMLKFTAIKARIRYNPKISIEEVRQFLKMEDNYDRKINVGIVGHGFVGNATEKGLKGSANKILIDPKHGTTIQVCQK